MDVAMSSTATRYTLYIKCCFTPIWELECYEEKKDLFNVWLDFHSDKVPTITRTSGGRERRKNLLATIPPQEHEHVPTPG